MRRDLEKFEKLDGFLYPILADNEKNAQKMEQKYARKYAIFYDPSKKVPNLLNQQVKILKLGRMPGLLIIDKQGIVQYAYYSDSMSDIPSNEELLSELRKIKS